MNTKRSAPHTSPPSEEPTRAATDTAGRDHRREAQRIAIETAALRLLDEQGPDAVTTRAVSAAAGVQAMTIYRLYGDMDGLVANAAARCVADYVEAKTTRVRREDPVDDLRAGWDLHVEFGLNHPYVYAQIYGRHAPGQTSPATEESAAILRSLVQRVAEAGRLTRDVETAAQMIHAAGCGVTFTLMAIPPEQRDMSLSHSCREAILSATTVSDTGPSDGTTRAASDEPLTADNRRHAVALTAALSAHESPSPFTDAERALLQEWLDRLT